MNFVKSTFRASQYSSISGRNLFSIQINTFKSYRSAEYSTGIPIKDIVEIKSHEEFEKILKSSSWPLIVDFYASWCGPCKMLTPKLVEAVKEDGRFKLLKVNIDNNPEVAQAFSVTSVPTVHVIHKERPVKYFVGFQNTPGLVNFLKGVAEEIGLPDTSPSPSKE